MNRTKEASVLILVILFFVSCVTPPKCVYEVLANTKFNDSLSGYEISRPKNENMYPFTLNYKKHYGCPVVSIQIDGKLLTFLVDTGSERSWIYTSGIKKLYGNIETFEDNSFSGYIEYIKQSEPDRIKNKSENQLKKMMYKDVADFRVVFTVSSSFTNFMFRPKDDNIDGIIGQDFMKKHKIVTFDFINNVLVLDGEKLIGQGIPFIETDMEDVFIEFSYQGKKEYGFLDTGNYTFSPRSNFGKDEIHYDFKRNNDYSVSYSGKVKKRIPWLLTFQDIKISNVEYKDIKGIYSNVWFSTYNKGAQNMLLYVNGLGCEFFRNHIIQFDYENKTFIIQ